ncbi:hypothetical protein BC332_24555 [Capsicum chinense]|nr:hypothetical protein BC332_24555 [Capsicum chinense]
MMRALVLILNDEAELTNMLQRSLKGKRYLIVLDDMWKSEAWDAVRLCFPSENKGSGILMTTRNTEVARYAGIENLSLQMAFMYQDDSWNLFKSAAFANEALPSEYENIGKQIADEYHGLPLTIVVVAGLLKSQRTIEDWKSVAEDVKSFVANNPDERCSCVLGLSYNHLTNGLKTCLLYFGTFLEDTEIPVKHLMRLWMAEGFLNLESDLEGEAEKCLQELVDRCLVLVCKKSLDGTKIRSYANQVSSECQSLMQMHPFKRLIGDEIDSSPYGLYRALPTPQLEILSLTCVDYSLLSVIIPSAKSFPATLKKLKLKSTSLSWSDLDIIAELPNLEVLKLISGACCGGEWHPNLRGFTRLKLLLIEHSSLKYWKATDDNFPVLERLLIRAPLD